MFSIFSAFTGRHSQFLHISAKTSASLLFFLLGACYTPFSFTLHMEKEEENVCRSHSKCEMRKYLDCV